VSADAAPSCGKGPQAAISAPITEMPLGTYSFSIRERFLFRGSLEQVLPRSMLNANPVNAREFLQNLFASEAAKSRVPLTAEWRVHLVLNLVRRDRAGFSTTYERESKQRNPDPKVSKT
jgi:hypothetical protein